MSQFQYWQDLGPCPTTGIKRVKGAWAEGCPMPDFYLNERPVYVGDCHLAHVDSFVEEASYADTGDDLSDDELERLTELDEVQEYLYFENLEKYGYFQK